MTEQVQYLAEWINEADAIVIGAGSGLSTAAGFSYSGARFREWFSDFEAAYGFHDMYSGGFYPFPDLETFWGYWSRMIWANWYDCQVGQPYRDLLEVVRGHDYFVLTTNVDHQFQRAGFDKHRLFYTQGDYGLLQCSRPCHQETYDNQELVEQMVQQQKDMRVPTALVPHCPHCGAPMTTNLRCDDSFVQDEGWYEAAERYEAFLNTRKGSKMLYLELGVGMNTPGIIKYPFWQMTFADSEARYAAVNQGEAYAPHEIRTRSLCLNGDLAAVLGELVTVSSL